MIPSILLIPEFNISAFASTDLLKASRLSQRLKAQHFEDWRELVADHGIDAIVVAGPPAFNADVIEESLTAGKPIFSEKPCAPNTQRLLQLIEVKKRCGGHTQVGFNFRHSRYFTNLVSLESRFGRIVTLDIEFSSNKPLNPLWGCNDVFESFLLSVGIHPLDTLCSLLTGEFDYKSSVSELSQEVYQLRVLANDDSRTVTVLTGNYSPRFFASFRATFENGCVATTNSDMPSLINVHSHSIPRPSASKTGIKCNECVEIRKEIGIEREGSGYEAEMRMFYQLVKRAVSNDFSIDNSLPTLNLIEKILNK